MIFTLNVPTLEFTFRQEKIVQSAPLEDKHFWWDIQPPQGSPPS
jgi:hypothetical protein